MNAAQFKQEFLTGYNAISSFGAPGYKDWEISTFLTKAQERIVLKRLNARGNKYGEGVEQTEKRRVDLSMLTTSALLTPASNQEGTFENGTMFDLPDDFLYTLNERAITSILDCDRLDQHMMIIEAHDNQRIPNLKPNTNIYNNETQEQVAVVVSGTTNYVYVTLFDTSTPQGTILNDGKGNVFTLKDIFPATYITNIKPITHDEYNINRNNPFKKPYEQLLWRMDYQGKALTSNHEIVTDGVITVKYYMLRYYRRPRPIIVGNITPRMIEGYSNVTECELNSIVHREIIDEAIMIADANAEARKVQINAMETQKSE